MYDSTMPSTYINYVVISRQFFLLASSPGLLRGEGREGLQCMHMMYMHQRFHKNVHKKVPYTNPYHVLTSPYVYRTQYVLLTLH
jgi:hypothetical protein